MATDTAPAAVPDPSGRPAAGSPDTGLTGLLNPVEPARPTSASFTLHPAAAQEPAAPDEAYAGTTSAIYNDGSDPAKNAAGKGQDTSVMRAFALAAIERWKKGADARNKRLDIRKAQAQAHQVKEARTVNRSEKILSGASNSGTGSGKSLDSKARNGGGGAKSSHSGHGSPKGGGGHKGGSGRGSGTGLGSGGRKDSGGGKPRHGNSGGGSGLGRSGGGNGPSSGGSTTKNRPGLGGHHDAKGGRKGSGKGDHAGTDGGKNGAAGNGPSAKTGPQGKPGPAGKDGKQNNHHAAGPSSNSSGTGNGGRTKLSDALKHDTQQAADRRLAQRRAQDTSTPVLWKDAKDRVGKDPKTTGPHGKPNTLTPGQDGRTPDKPTDSSKGPQTASDASRTPDKNTPGAKDSKKQPGTDTARRKRVNTLPSRETGYRDGARTATAIGHIKAYRDGFKDGHQDTSTTVRRQKHLLDKAHAQRQAARDKDQPVTASSTDHATPSGPQAVNVKEVTGTHVTLDGGQTYTRGEVRNLKQYERRMGEKATTMGKAAEGTKHLQAHALEQADQALKYIELAKNVEGGDKLTGALNRLHESATVQARKAEELHRRVVRAAENTRVVLTNVETRYGSIYKAVCDSNLTKPAELAWYRK